MYEFLELPISEKEFVNISEYKGKFKVRDMIRIFISTLFNNPSKAMVFLALSHLNFEKARQIQRKILKDFFGTTDSRKLKEEGIKIIAPNTIKGYFEKSVSQHSHFIEKQVEENTFTYRKTADGSVIGDLIAIYCILSSSDSEIKASNYSIFGIASSPGETDAQTNSLLLLLYLYFNNVDRNNPRRLADVTRDFEYVNGTFTKKDYQRGYQRIRWRLRANNIRRLAKIGLIYYESKKQNEESRYVFQKDLSKSELEKIVEELKRRYSEPTLRNFEIYGRKILGVLKNSEKPLSAKEIAKRLKIEVAASIMTPIKILSKYGYIRKVEGKSIDEYSLIYLTNEGKRWIERYLVDPDNVKVKTGLLDVLGISDIFRKYGVNYKTLDMEVEISEERLRYMYIVSKVLKEIIKERFEEFRERAYIARIRHQEESEYIKIREK